MSGLRRTLSGKVLSDKMDKTVIVSVIRRVKHPLYKKVISRTSKIHAHDEQNQCHEGDFVTIEETRPISKTKAWRLVSIDTAANRDEVVLDDTLLAGDQE